ELRRQKWMVRRRELELIASKNFLLPKLDAIGRYRWRGFGDDLFPGPNDPPLPRFDDAYADLLSGDFQEWQLGFEFNMPIGFREGHVAERNAELQLSRERAILRDQQREIAHEVADAVGEVDRAFTVLQTSYNRLAANRDQLGSVQAAYEADKAPLDLFLDAQRRVADAETDYYLNRSRYELALKNVHFVKGTLLDYDGVHLAEGPWPEAAYVDAARREASRSNPVPLNYASSHAPVVSAGPYPQHVDEQAPANAGNPAPAPTEQLPSPPPAALPSDEILPLPTPIKGASRPSPGPILKKAASTLAQPEAIQASAAESTIDKLHPIIGAGYGELAATPSATIALQPGAPRESSTQPTTAPSTPRRLPSTSQP
ncbi:MAG TPA: TolC family protein, partial [Lacipirellulaceae bacterium]|nr:TolC family protein [Lacipirellulaceae bacterium]